MMRQPRSGLSEPAGLAASPVPKCGSLNIQERKSRKPQPYRCRDCRKDFSVKTESLMHSSPLGCQTWVIAIYLLTTGIKGVSSPEASQGTQDHAEVSLVSCSQNQGELRG